MLCIEDTGIGVPEAELENIFNPFYRVDKSRARELGGSGLGLAIVKEIIAKHGGEIKIKSKPAIGTKIEVYFKKL